MAYRPGGHHWGYPLFRWRHCHWFEEQVSIELPSTAIYPIFKWFTMVWRGWEDTGIVIPKMATRWYTPLIITSVNPRSYHYSDVILRAMASQITGVSMVYSTICSGSDQRKHQRSASLAFVRGIHRSSVNSPQRASNAENVSIWWRHHAHGIDELAQSGLPQRIHTDTGFHCTCWVHRKLHRESFWV